MMYYAVVTWQDETSEADKTEYMLICAKTWSEAVMYIDQQLDHIENIRIERIQDDEQHVVFLTPTIANAAREENIW